jgi:hypothetical protein
VAILLAVNLLAGSAGNEDLNKVRVCLDAGESWAAVDPGRSLATRIFREVGIRLVWHASERSCQGDDPSILIRLSRETPKNELPSAFAYAKPFEGRHIVLFYDRMVAAFPPSFLPRATGYVLAHEIGHMLQATDQHNHKGIMKGRWSATEYAAIQTGELKFAEEDVTLIRSGLRRFVLPASPR